MVKYFNQTTISIVYYAYVNKTIIICNPISQITSIPEKLNFVFIITSKIKDILCIEIKSILRTSFENIGKLNNIM